MSRRAEFPCAGILVVLFLLLALVYGRVMIDGDGLTYYALTRSLVQDHDFDLTNQKKQIQGVMAPVSPETERHASLFSCGFGVMYAPLLFALDQIPGLNTLHPYPQNDRIPFPHALALFAGSSLCTIGTLLISFFFAVRRMSLSPILALVQGFILLIGTPLLFYSVCMPSYAHAADAFLCAAIFALVLSGWKSPWRNVLTGVALSLSVMLRNNNVVFWPVAAGALLWFQRERAYRTLLEIVAGALPGAILHAAFNFSQYGRLLTTGYRVQTGEGFLLEMLFHPDAGLFLWTPVTTLAAVGLLAGFFRKRPEAIVSLAAVLLVLLSVQFQPNWWGGCSFGPRFFTHLYFFWAAGLACLQGRYSRLLAGAAGVCALWTFLLLNAHLVNAGTPEGRRVLNDRNCRHTPLESIFAVAANYREAEMKGRATGVFSYWSACLSAKPYPTVLFLLYPPQRHSLRAGLW